MAAYAKHISFLFLLVLFFSINKVQARESKFFSKVTHNTNNGAMEYSKPLLLEAPAPAPEPAQLETEYGYGLYGHGSTEFPNTKTTTKTTTTAFTNSENELLAEELAGETYKESTTSNYNSNRYRGNYNGNGFQKSYKENGFESERQGMSDTRFVENGRYFYDAKNENNYLNGYESGKESSRNNEVYYGNNNVNSNEFNTMEEYYQKQGEYQENYEP